MLEYKAEPLEKLSIGALIGVPSEVTYVPIHETRIPRMTESLKSKISEGVSNMIVRLANVGLDENHLE